MSSSQERVSECQPGRSAQVSEPAHISDPRPPTPPSPASAQLRAPGTHDLNDLPSLTPSKSTTSVSDSESDSIPDGFTDDEETVLLDELSLVAGPREREQQPASSALRTPASNSSMRARSGGAPLSFSEPGPFRAGRLGRKRSLSELVALRYRGGKGAAEIGDEERGLLALDLDTYINSGDPDSPETRALPPSALFPTLSNLPTGSCQSPGSSTTPTSLTCHTRNGSEVSKTDQDQDQRRAVVRLNSNGLPLPPPRSEWPFGGTGPGKTSRGFIPGRMLGGCKAGLECLSDSNVCSDTTNTTTTTITTTTTTAASATPTTATLPATTPESN